MSAFAVAVDGPAGSGKSSVCRGVASELGMKYLDTGAMYRAMTWAMLDAHIDVGDAESIAAAAQSVQLTSGTDPRKPTISVNGQDVSEPIRSAEVTEAVSAVSAVPAVRQLLVELQRDEVAHAGASGIVVEGRDIGTVVLPDAPVKIFLTADPAIRALRRAKEDSERTHVQVSVADTEAALIARDEKDSTRASSPLAQAHDAIVVDTTELNLQQVITEVVSKIKAASGA
jgi:cytidylate kinase